MMRNVAVVFLSLAGLAGCAMGPKYVRPDVETPVAFRGATATPAEIAGWQDVFSDAQLQALLTEALENNYDVRIAAARVLEARANYRIDRSVLFPTVNLAGDVTETEISRAGLNLPASVPIKREQTVGNAGLQLSYELDFWGRLRRLSEAGKAEYLGTEWAARQVRVDLIGDIARAYYDLLEIERELEISRRTLETRQESLRLTQRRLDQGVSNALEVRQAENLVYSASTRIPRLELLQSQLQNLLSFLLGRNPGEIELGTPLEAAGTPTVPPGLPSQLLERRPDIVSAEQRLIAANARIGAAKAALFPTFSLTGVFGFASRELDQFLDGDARQRSLAAGVLAPIFQGGRLRAQVRVSEAQQEQMLIEYERAIRGALREVADALTAVERTRQEYEQQSLLVNALREANRLSNLRYRGGVDNYLQVLDAERDLFAGELTLAQVRRDEWSAMIDLYRAIGGGWTP